MSYMKTGWARTAFITAVAVGMMAGFCEDAVAERNNNMHHAHKLARHPHNIPSSFGETTQLAWPQPVRLGPMHYYGGPKSPMWRAPAEN